MYLSTLLKVTMAEDLVRNQLGLDGASWLLLMKVEQQMPATDKRYCCCCHC